MIYPLADSRRKRKESAFLRKGEGLRTSEVGPQFEGGWGKNRSTEQGRGKDRADCHSFRVLGSLFREKGEKESENSAVKGITSY